MNEIIFNKIKTSTSLWKEDLKTFIGNNQKKPGETNCYYWLSFDGLNKIISRNPYDHLESEM